MLRGPGRGEAVLRGRAAAGWERGRAASRLILILLRCARHGAQPRASLAVARAVRRAAPPLAAAAAFSCYGRRRAAASGVHHLPGHRGQVQPGGRRGCRVRAVPPAEPLVSPRGDRIAARQRLFTRSGAAVGARSGPGRARAPLPELSRCCSAGGCPQGLTGGWEAPPPYRLCSFTCCCLSFLCLSI